MQNYTPLGSTATTTVKQAIQNHENNINSIRTSNSGTAFPTANLVAGMKCYRTDLKATYTYNGSSWIRDVDENGTVSEANIAPITGATYVPPLARALIDNCRANKLAFLPADQIIVEKTVDGGKTWTDAGVSDSAKASVFSGVQTGVFSIPQIDGKMNTLCGLRITFSAMKYNVPSGTTETEKYKYWTKDYVKSQERYCTLDYFWFWLSASNNAISVKLESATGGNPNNWVTRYDGGLHMTGWSGPDIIKVGSNAFGGGTSQTGNYWNYRFTCMTVPTSGQSKLGTGYETQVQQIFAIRGYGDRTWGISNNLMNIDTIYSVGVDKSTTFPATVSAPTFKENGKNLADIYQGKLTFDTTPTSGSTNPVTSDGIKKAVEAGGLLVTDSDGDIVLKR